MIRQFGQIAPDFPLPVQFGAAKLGRPPVEAGEEHPLAAPEWTLPARHVAGLAATAVAVCAGLALLA